MATLEISARGLSFLNDGIGTPVPTAGHRETYFFMANPPPTFSDRPAAGLRIVAVEDETLIALDLQDTLMQAGASEVVIARDAASLVDILRRGRADLAIVNVEPAHDGASTAARMLREAGVPFFFATGANDPAALRSVSVPVVAKPYSTHTILAALAETLASRSR